MAELAAQGVGHLLDLLSQIGISRIDLMVSQPFLAEAIPVFGLFLRNRIHRPPCDEISRVLLFPMREMALRNGGWGGRIVEAEFHKSSPLSPLSGRTVINCAKFN